MTDAIAPIATTDLGGSASVTPAPTPVNPGSELDRDAFLKLLVAQLKYQDPTNPTDPSTMMAQTSQLSMVEKLDEISKVLTEAAATDQLAIAGSMVGRDITFQADGGPQTGVVEAVRFVGGEFVLSAGGFAVPIAAVTEIRATPAPPAAAATTSAPVTPAVESSTTTAQSPLQRSW